MILFVSEMAGTAFLIYFKEFRVMKETKEDLSSLEEEAWSILNENLDDYVELAKV